VFRRLIAFVRFWRWIWSREQLPEQGPGGSLPRSTGPGRPAGSLVAHEEVPRWKPLQGPARPFSFRALLAREPLPPARPDSLPTGRFSLRALLTREALPPPLPEFAGHGRGLLRFLAAREALPRRSPDPGARQGNDNRE
jgi:hypothetical protein